MDHLLFTLALLIITRKLVKTMGAFTLSHSVTLTAVTLGFVHVPTKPVEAVIALSIVFVAVEIVHSKRGVVRIAANAPWVVAFAFGLIPGLGFASGLSDIGLPAGTSRPRSYFSASASSQVTSCSSARCSPSSP